MWEEIRLGTREGVGWRRRNGMHGEGLTQGGVRSSACLEGLRACPIFRLPEHPEHLLHVRDLGRVEAERLVERLRLLLSRKAGMRCGKGAAREA